uniref:Uncharacterized protein n=1 Tax=Hordeum vulgare subsp. vulgare TaxID=112509 RepID=A0A8I6YCB3_HORVV
MDLSAANMKPERDGDTPSLSRTKRKHEEAASTKDGLCRSDRSTPQAAHGCSAADRGLGAPPGFHPKPPHSPVADTNDGDSAGWQAAKKALERITTPWRERAFAAAKPSDVVSSSYSAMLQAANYASFSLDYTLELKEKLAARDAEVAALQEQLESAKADLTAAKLAAEAEVERARTTAVQQFLSSNEYKRRLAEHALAG